MSTQYILAEKTVSLSEFRKKPTAYFQDEPIAVLNNNVPAGYVLSAKLFQQLVRLAEKQTLEENNSIRSTFRPNRARLETIAMTAEKLFDEGEKTVTISDFQEE